MLIKRTKLCILVIFHMLASSVCAESEDTMENQVATDVVLFVSPTCGAKKGGLCGRLLSSPGKLL